MSLRQYKRFCAGLNRGVEFTLVALLGGLVVLVAVDTALWSLLEVSSPVVAEIQSILQIWFGLLAAATGVKHGTHLGMSLLVDRLPQTARIWSRVLVHLFEAIFGLLFVIYGVQLARAVSNTLPGLGIGASFQYVPTFAAGLLIVVFALEKLFVPSSENSTLQVGNSNG